ncbi:MAG: DUF411 domain-containing protein [Pseudomonadota bacterium]
MAMVTTNTDPVSRRSVSGLIFGLAGAVALGQPLSVLAASPKDQVTVWKTPNCGCCNEWVSHLRSNGFEVVTHDVKDTASVRQKLGLAEKFGSCHTGLLDNYVLEGHVPAKEMRRLLREKPNALGLAVPGMPAGSPGMEMGNIQDAFDVLLVLKDGNTRIYQSYPQKSSS